MIAETPHPEGTGVNFVRFARGVSCLLLGLALGGCSPDAAREKPGEKEPPELESSAATTDEAPLDRPEGWAEQHPVVSPNADFSLHWAEVAERSRPRDPADGAGRVWLERVRAIPPYPPSASAPSPRSSESVGRLTVEAGSRQRIEAVFEVADSGIAEGGLIFIQADPFWSWSEAQTRDRRASGYTTAKARWPGVELIPSDGASAFEVRGRALEGGEKIDLVYGAGPTGARVDDYSERGSPLLVGVDATGDGTRAWLSPPALLDISAQAPVAVVAFGPGDIAPGEPFEISLALLDPKGNAAAWPRARATQTPAAEEASAPPTCPTFEFTVTSAGDSKSTRAPKRLPVQDACAPHTRKTLRMIAPNQEGVLRFHLEGHGALASFAADVNPIVVRDSNRRLIWGDLHGHSNLSDGTGTPEDYFLYARDVARLDAVALTDHDHWGFRPLDEHPEIVEQIRETTNVFHAPDHFITLPGYEWTSWIHGHRHVLSFDDQLPFHSSLDPETDRPDELWEALRSQSVLTFAHHSAGEPVATNWFYPPDPVLEPVTEIVSVHGMSEAADAPAPVRGGEPGYFVRDALLRGDRLGFIGSGDSHDGHPGLTQIAGGQGGLAGIMTTALSRPDLLESLRRRHTFATNGIRPFLEVHIEQTPMGGRLLVPPTPDAGGPEDVRLRIRYEATAPIKRIDLVRTGRVARVPGEAAMSLDLERVIPGLRPGEFHYVRILEEGGGTAWSSPIFVDVDPASTP